MHGKVKTATNIWIEDGLIEVINTATRKYLSIQTRLRLQKWKYRMNGYISIGDPLRVFTVSHDDMNYISNYSGGGLFLIQGGDWHKQRMPFEETYRYSMFKKHFYNGVPWDEIDEFRELAAGIHHYGSIKTLDLPADEQSVDTLKQYYGYIDELYHDIQEQGYKWQTELDSSNDFANRSQHPALNEIQVCIGPEGDMMVKSGFHRYTIAKLLNLDEIPVRVQIRHADWQKIRDEIYLRDRLRRPMEGVEDHTDHPEVRDLVDSESNN